VRIVVAFVLVFAIVLAVLATAGCAARSSDPGTSADLQVRGGAFALGPLPAPSTGPQVASLQLSEVRVSAGEQERPLLGVLGPTATSVLLGLDGDRGYWVVGAGVPSPDAPSLPTFDVRLGFARDLAAGPRTLVAEAVDATGHVGARVTQTLDVTAASLPSAPMVVHLEWHGDADLDLHVIIPDGTEIWSRHPSGYRAPLPPAPPDPNGPANAPLLDGDSNAMCVIDARNQENVVWPLQPASGHYIVRVDAASLCGLPYSDWRVDRVVDGAVVATASGEALDSDTRGDHALGAGRTALEFDVP
jgi:hypothetical protein